MNVAMVTLRTRLKMAFRQNAVRSVALNQSGSTGDRHPHAVRTLSSSCCCRYTNCHRQQIEIGGGGTYTGCSPQKGGFAFRLVLEALEVSNQKSIFWSFLLNKSKWSKCHKIRVSESLMFWSMMVQLKIRIVNWRDTNYEIWFYFQQEKSYSTCWHSNKVIYYNEFVAFAAFYW